MGKLVRGEHVEVGSAEEAEIRGCSIWAVEVCAATVRYKRYSYVLLLMTNVLLNVHMYACFNPPPPH